MPRTKLVSFKFYEDDVKRLSELVRQLALEDRVNGWWSTNGTKTDAVRIAIKEALSKRTKPTSDNATTSSAKYVPAGGSAKKAKAAKKAAKRGKKRG